MKTLRASAAFWIAGALTAFAGVALARMVGPSLAGNWRVGTVVAGQLLAVTGLFIICLGVRRRISKAAEQ